jgi:DNA modification methylase
VTWQILTGDALAMLQAMPAGTAQTCVTSPPYWGLRDYGVDGQIGLELTPEAFVARMVEVFREVRRVLANDGTLWLNLGDTYATFAGAVGSAPGGGAQGAKWAGRVSPTKGPKARALRDPRHAGKNTGIVAVGPMTQPNRRHIPGLKPKDLVGIPWQVAFALRADGWYLRADIVWHKPNPMPESVRDRPTKAHEYLFLLSKSEHYLYDANAIAEPLLHPEASTPDDVGRAFSRRRATVPSPRQDAIGSEPEAPAVPSTRNRRSVWTIPTQPFPGAHFATFPTALVEPCVLAGSREGDLVLDPFAGAGTTGLVATRLGRSFTGIELNPAYAELARDRIRGDAPLLNTAAEGGR